MIKSVNSYNIPLKSASFKGGETPTLTIEGTKTKAKVYTDDIDKTTAEQIKTICSHPVFQDLPVRIMPDAHAGKNTVVGFTSPIGIKGEIIPAIIGTDIGCGILCTEIDTKGSIDFAKLDSVIRNFISNNKKEPAYISKAISENLREELDVVCRENEENTLGHIGTLGGGNHFIEIDCDSSGKKYLIVHTGSRNLGRQTAEKYLNKAQRQNPYGIKELSYLTGDEAKKYLSDIKTVQEYAKANRQAITDTIIEKMGWKKISSFESMHNYIDKNGIIRKGAIEAEKGQKIIIPLNMKDGALIAYGKGNSDWNNSAPHGAGRKLSRMQAKEDISLDEYQKSMQGIYTTCISPKTIDEAPQAYKNSKKIENCIEPAAAVEKRIKPLYNFKNKR
ncbi:MAG: RtcB family protein [Candidatus Gastranaerophilales bacterium]|nr:RtcB family protein [Candidatus Gastranaerophilales bacterium]